jgi:two-component sensor histidine kinase
MSQSDKPLPTPEEYADLVLYYRKMKHDINNSLAVMMALAELSQRRAEHVPKLIDIVLEKATKTAEDLKLFQAKLNALLPAVPE